MITLERVSWPRLYADALRQAAEEGYARPSRDGDTIDLGPALLKCPAPVFGLIRGRGGSCDFATLEQLGYLAGIGSDHLLSVAPSYLQFKDPQLGWHGAYGPRLKDQLPLAVEELSRRPFSRRAVALVWNERDIHYVAQGRLKDVPCTLGVGFWIGPAGEVRAEGFMRSTDLWLGLYYDLPAFAFLQRAVAKALQRGVGPTYLSTSSLHLYSRNAPAAAKIEGRYANEQRVHGALPEPDLSRAASATERWHWLVEWANRQIKFTLNELMGRKLQDA